MRTTAISPRSSLGSRLDDLLATRFSLQSRQHRITCAADLPVPLEQAVQQLVRRCEWRAFGVAGDVFTAIARAGREPRAAFATAALEVYLLDALGTVYSACRWEHDSKRGWWLDSVLDLSYDCDHGWWLADLMATERAVVEGAARQSARQSASLLEHAPRALR